MAATDATSRSSSPGSQQQVAPTTTPPDQPPLASGMMSAASASPSVPPANAADAASIRNIPIELFYCFLDRLEIETVCMLRQVCRGLRPTTDGYLKSLIARNGFNAAFTVVGLQKLRCFSISPFAVYVSSLHLAAMHYALEEDWAVGVWTPDIPGEAGAAEAAKAQERCHFLQRLHEQRHIAVNTGDFIIELAACLVNFTNLKEVTLLDELEQNYFPSVAFNQESHPFNTWGLHTLTFALGRAERSLSKLAMVDDRESTIDEYILNEYDPDVTRDPYMLPQLRELELLFPEWFPEPYKYQRIPEILKCAPNITSLSLTRLESTPDKEVWEDAEDQRGAFHHIADHARLVGLERFSIKGFKVGDGSLLKFFRNHKDTLRRARIAGCQHETEDCEPDTWFTVRAFLRDEMHLEEGQPDIDDAIR